MKKYKLHKGQPESLREEDILKYKDFGRLRHQYDQVTKRPKQPLYKNPYMFLVLVIIILLALMLAGEI